MKYSILIPAKDEELYIGKALEMLISIGDVDWEAIVIDDHSNDGTFDLAKRYQAQDNRIKVFKNREAPVE